MMKIEESRIYIHIFRDVALAVLEASFSRFNIQNGVDVTVAKELPRSTGSRVFLTDDLSHD